MGDHRPIAVDVRIIAATNRNLGELVAEKTFREDFFFRINVIPIHLPPLQERMEDIPLLVDHFIRHLRARTDKDMSGLSPEAMKLFMGYHWPGNVRELKSALEYAFVIGERGLIQPEQLPLHIGKDGRAEACSPSLNAGDVEDKAALVDALRKSRGNKSEAARLLGISRVTVWNRMRKFNIDLKKVVAGG